jgi:DNA-binding transcriptional LysR family regulator
VRLFVRAIELGSFSAVARTEGTSQPTVSKSIAGLERELGVRLIARSTTSLAATDEGRRFYQRCRQLLEDYDDAVLDVRGQVQEVVGVLTVSAPLGLGQLRLNALVLEFLAAHPGLEIALLLNDRMVDLVEEGVDVAIRLAGDIPPNAVARPVASSPRVVVASPGYLRRAAPITTPPDLEKHEVVRFAGLASRGILDFASGSQQIKVETSGRYQINNSLALRECLVEGIAMGSAPAWLVQDLIDAGDLVRVLPEWTLPSQLLHLVYPSRRYLPLRTRAFVQFMASKIVALPGFARASKLG